MLPVVIMYISSWLVYFIHFTVLLIYERLGTIGIIVNSPAVHWTCGEKMKWSF